MVACIELLHQPNQHPKYCTMVPFETVLAGDEVVCNEVDCPLLTLTKDIFFISPFDLISSVCCSRVFCCHASLCIATHLEWWNVKQLTHLIDGITTSSLPYVMLLNINSYNYGSHSYTCETTLLKFLLHNCDTTVWSNILPKTLVTTLFNTEVYILVYRCVTRKQVWLCTQAKWWQLFISVHMPAKVLTLHD